MGFVVSSWHGGICVFFAGRAGGCTNHLDHGVWLLGDMGRAYDAETAPFNVRVYGVAVDGIDSLVLTRPDGRGVTLPVVNNVFDGTLPNTTFAEVATVTVELSSGRSESIDPARYFVLAPLEAFKPRTE